jgi:hypothetical protein
MNATPLSIEKKSVAILTNFMDFNPGYSLSGIVVDQAYMLAKYGHKVVIYVNEQYNDKFEADAGITKLKDKFAGLIKVKRMTKFMHLIDYDSAEKLTEDHKEAAEHAGRIYFNEFQKESISVAFTHDFIFTGWNLPYSIAIKNADKQLKENDINISWFHWVHSIPSGRRDWWDLSAYGKNHKIVFPTKTEVMRVAESFRTNPSQVAIIPHIKDIRMWYEFGNDSIDFIEAYPKMMEADVVQVYPCSSDRFAAKQLGLIIKMFSFMKVIGSASVFLAIANQWATGLQRREDIKMYIELGEQHGLAYGKEFIFTSDYDSKFETGIGRKMLRELQLISNLFIFPTMEESFGLVGPEAAFSGSLIVMNKSLTMMYEVLGSLSPAFEFSSFHSFTEATKDNNYLTAISMAILNHIYTNPAIMTKTYCRKRYNHDHLYKRYYLPKISN